MKRKTAKELLEIVKDNYEKISNDFNETRKKRIWQEIEKISQSIKNNSKVLDLGCGNGRLLEILKNKKINYLGVDNNEKLLFFAKKKYPQYNFLKADILNLNNISEMNFDYIFLIAVLHHIPGERLQVKALKQIKNKIKKNGKIIISNWNLWQSKKHRKLIYRFAFLKLIKKNKMNFGDILFDWKNSQGKILSKRYYHAFTKRELKKIAKKAGLKIEKIYKDKYNYYIILKK